MEAFECEVEISPPVDNREVAHLHAAAFGGQVVDVPWGERLARHSLFWVCAREGGQLVGFVNVIGDGGLHAVLLDTCVRPDRQGRGLGALLVRSAADEARRRGCHWLHADYEPHLVSFYEGRSGMKSTAAGLLRLN